MRFHVQFQRDRCIHCVQKAMAFVNVQHATLLQFGVCWEEFHSAVSACLRSFRAVLGDGELSSVIYTT